MKTVTVCILILLSIVLLFRCVKEVSCEEGCGGEEYTIPPLIPPAKIPPKDTTQIKYNELISYYDFELINADVRKAYMCFWEKFHPGLYHIADSIPIQSSTISHYNGSFNLKNYIDESIYTKGDTFKVFYQIRYKNATMVETDSATLIY